MTRLTLSLITLSICVPGCATGDKPVASSEDNPGSSSAHPSQVTHAPSAPNPKQELAKPSPTPPTGEYVSFPTIGIKLRRPVGFDDAENFHGFVQPSTQASVMASMIPGPFSEVCEGLTEQRLAARKMVLRSRQEVDVDGCAGVLINVTQVAFEAEFQKWFLVFGDTKQTKMVMAAFRADAPAELGEQLKAVVLSTCPDHAPKPTPESEAAFTLARSDKLRLTSGMVMSKMLAYTKDGTMPVSSPADPIFMAAPALGDIQIDNRRQSAVQRLFQTAHTKITQLDSVDEIAIDGLDGYEITATAVDADSGTPIVVYHVMLFGDRTYFLMQGLVGVQLSDEYLPEFKRMARSFRRR
jgi:hypothetical protein